MTLEQTHRHGGRHLRLGASRSTAGEHAGWMPGTTDKIWSTALSPAF